MSGGNNTFSIHHPPLRFPRSRDEKYLRLITGVGGLMIQGKARREGGSEQKKKVGTHNPNEIFRSFNGRYAGDCNMHSVL